jgi:hypothetical protein
VTVGRDTQGFPAIGLDDQRLVIRRAHEVVGRIRPRIPCKSLFLAGWRPKYLKRMQCLARENARKVLLVDDHSPCSGFHRKFLLMFWSDRNPFAPTLEEANCAVNAARYTNKSNKFHGVSYWRERRPEMAVAYITREFGLSHLSVW